MECLYLQIFITFNIMGKEATFTKNSSQSFMKKRLETDYAMQRQVGINLRYFRKQRKVSQAVLGEMCHITTYIISNIESKPYYGVKLKTLKDIADALGINICDLICCQH